MFRLSVDPYPAKLIYFWLHCYKTMDTTPTRHSPNTVLMLDQHVRHWPNNKPTLAECTIFGKPSCAYIKRVSCFEIPAVIQSVSWVSAIVEMKLATFSGCGYRDMIQRCQFSGNSRISGFVQILNDTVWPKNVFFWPKMAFFRLQKKYIRILSHDPLASLIISRICSLLLAKNVQISLATRKIF